MITVFLKELRENLKWAAVICAVIGIMVYWNVRRATPTLLQIQLPQPTTVLFGALAGLLLGFVQTLFETKPDNWAFVVHRPASRVGIFAAKCAAGLLLLYVSLGLPCALAAYWAAQPGNIPAPFQARMMLPMAADILAAGCYYFVGMMLTLRKARWFGTRLLPLGLALVATLAANFSQQFWLAATIILACQAIAALGAWEVFNTGGAADRSGLPKFALGAAIYCGALAVLVLLVPALGALQTTIAWRQYRLDQNGEVLIINKTMAANEFSTVITDVAGRVLPEYEGVDVNDPAFASRFLTGEKGLVDEQVIPWPFSLEQHGFRQPLPGVVPLRAVAAPNVKVKWSCLFNVERRIIEIYDPSTATLTGTIGPAGFAAGQSPPAELFPARPLNIAAQNSTHTLAFESCVYWMELDQRRTRRIFTAAADDPIISATELPPTADPTVVILTHRRIHTLRPSGETLFSIPLNYDPAKHWFAVAMIPANQHLMVWAGVMAHDSDPAFHQERSEYGPDGALLRRTAIPVLPPIETPLVQRRTAMFGAIYPPAALPLFNAPVAAFVFDIDAQRLSRLFYGFLFGACGLCGLLSCLLARRYRFSRRKTIAWIAANMLLGPAGIVVLLGLNDRPALEGCAVCGGKRLAGRRECTACGAAAPPPRGDGREIFEPLAALPA